MFAVPGWSVSSSLLKAERPEGAKSAPSKATEPEVVIEGESKKSSKKRKRNAEMGKKGPKDVNAGNMEELWEAVIEGKPKEKKLKQGEKTKMIAEEEAVDGEKSKATSGSKSKEVRNLKDSASGDEIEGSDEVIEASKERVKKGKTLKEKKREKRAKLKAIADGTTPDMTTTSSITESIQPPTTKPTSQPPKPTLTPLQASMRQKLISARFRHLNQTLYTTPSAHSLSLFAENPEMFTEYHEGFRRQVEVWPENPVDIYLSQILNRGAIKGPSRGNPLSKTTQDQPLPRTEGTCTLADLGCGDAALATKLQPHLKKLKLRIHSFDLQSPSPLVTKADIANLPLKDGSVDVAIFCLALMGTNWVDFIEEAFRILRWKGELWIAEIKSRFGRVASAGSGGGAGAGGRKVVSHSVGNKKRAPTMDKKSKKAADEAADDEIAAVEVDGQDDRGGETDVSAFVEVLRKRGFVLKGEGQGGEKASVDLGNRMFVRMGFVKGTTPIKGKCVPVPKGAEEFGSADRRGGKGGETWKRKPKGKFVDEMKGEEDGHVSSEAGVLKPCVYKLR
ncbi:methyltransferase-domain-containing protein [Leptodontidium sp. MPI-SDFR-AT-0119]|nr:methyltransferase-domain-containing protein [Leptodontidium sp. MPI-SDFR-AT-0119]